MTILDSKMYLAVMPKECLAWNKKDKETNAPNIWWVDGCERKRKREREKDK
jgi:hypothetical protein